ncbi:unnamed protein product [Moneuplotes crassus]|uniref:Uncharacterized protein n=2 Tax=Euplotes crassus TaxID=5936 RepID=A0AAD1XVG2_EUPCR|nr:unnamed protein product [Moneuplotes crassus]
MGTCCTTPSAHTKEQAEKDIKKHKRGEKQTKPKEPSVDYSDFRNNPILKPAPLDNPQDHGSNPDDMGLSMATASKLHNIQPKDERTESKVVEFGVDMRNMNDTVRESQISRNTEKRHPDDIVVSFKPSNLTNQTDDLDSLDMSFGGARSSGFKSDYNSTVIRANEETHDTGRAPDEYQ